MPKASGVVRICADLFDANCAVISDRYPLPTIEELSDSLQATGFFFNNRPQVLLLASRTQVVGAIPYSNDHAVGLVLVTLTTLRIVECSTLFPEDHGKTSFTGSTA